MARGIVNIAHRHECKVVTVVHGLEVTREMPKIKRMWLEKTLQNSDFVVAVSGFTRQRVLQKYLLEPEKVIVLPNGVDTEKFYPDAETTKLRRRLGIENVKIILTLARVIERKGHDRVIEALPKVLQEIPNVKYIICGPWEQSFYEKLQKMISELGLRERVIFTGYVDPAELNAFYNLCDVYIMPSRELVEKGDTEGFGITYLEANACEKPVIGGKSGGVGDAIVDGQTGFLVDPLDSGEIAEKLILLLSDPELSRRLGRQGRKRIEERYTWQRLAEELGKHIGLVL